MIKVKGQLGLRIIKLLHIILVVLFLGGIVSTAILIFTMDAKVYANVLGTYTAMNVLFNDVVRIGSVGTLLVGLTYGLFTNWGFFRHRWIMIKWFILVIQIAMGLLIIDRTISTNLTMIASTSAAILGDSTFKTNNTLLSLVLAIELGLAFVVLIMSIWKPGKKKTVAVHPSIETK